MLRIAFLCLYGITLIACQSEALAPPAEASSPLDELALSEDVQPVCEPTGQVRIDSQRMLAFEMNCVDHKDDSLRMDGVAMRFSSYENGWYDGPFTDAIFTLVPQEGRGSASNPDLVVMYLENGEKQIHVAESRGVQDGGYSLRELNLRYEALK